jgi:uncharacterized protein
MLTLKRAAVALVLVLAPWTAADRATAQVEAPAWSRVQKSLVVVGYKPANGPFVQYGTAFCIQSNGSTAEFLTDYHVVIAPTAPQPVSLVILLPNSQTTVPATVVRYDSDVDLAIVSASIPNMVALPISHSLPQDTQTIAVGGYPFIIGVRLGGLFGQQQRLQGTPTTTLAPDVHMGHVSSLQPEWIGFDIEGGTIDHGDSGGPLFDPQSGVIYGAMEGYIPGSTDSNAQGPVQATAYMNLAMRSDTLVAFINGQSPLASLPTHTNVSAVNDSTTIFRVAAAQQNAEAMNILGLTYRDGTNGSQRDYTQAVHWFRLAAAQGNADGESNLAIMYNDGHGVPRDYAQALYWFRLAAAQGEDAAENNLGYMYQDGHGVLQDYAQALHWFQLAAAQGNSDAEANTAYMYEHGQGVPQDYAQALHWYQLSAAQNDAVAENNIGTLYEYGHGVPQDYAQALHWFALSAVEGNATGADNMGNMFYVGHGVTQDYFEAMDWFGVAAAKGDATAENIIGLMYVLGNGVQQNLAQALHWFRLAAAKGDAGAEYNIGYMYEHGAGVPHDNAQALHWYRLAEAQGNADAKLGVLRVQRLLHQSRP